MYDIDTKIEHILKKIIDKYPHLLKYKTDIRLAILEGIEIGREEERIKNIKKAISRQKLTLQEIAEDFDVTLEFVEKIKKQIE